MRLDMNTVRSLADASDDRLWHTLKMLTGGMGMDLPGSRRGRLHYGAIRELLRDITEEDVARVNVLLENYGRYKRWGGGGR